MTHAEQCKANLETLAEQVADALVRLKLVKPDFDWLTKFNRLVYHAYMERRKGVADQV